MIATFGIMYLRHQVEDIYYLSSSLCILFGKTENSMTQNVATIVTSIYLLFTLLVILMVNFKLIIGSGQSENILDELKQKKTHKIITTHVILAGVTNAMCWIPTSAFYLVSAFGEEVPVVWLYWITLVVLPINSMVNPILFNLSEIRSKINY